MPSIFKAGDRIAFIGVGQMGVHMANAVQSAGFAVAGWTRSGGKGLGDVQFEVVADLMSTVRGAKAVILCLRDHEVTEEVLFSSGLVEGLDVDTLVVDMGTTGPNVAKSHSERIAKRGISYLDAPVSGGTAGAAESQLSIFVGGDPGIFATAEPLLRSMGRPVYLGPVGSGQTAKLANQIIVGITIAAVAEGMVFAERQGINSNALLSALKGGFAGSKVLEVHGPRMVARTFSAPGQISLHLKDLRLAQASEGFFELPHASAVVTGFEGLASSGSGSLDHSAYITLYDTREKKV